MRSPISIVLIAQRPEQTLSDRLVDPPPVEGVHAFGVPLLQNSLNERLPLSSAAPVKKIIELSTNEISALQSGEFQK
jgi:hypothetical protein